MSEASETPSIATYRKKCKYVKTTMRMLTILCEAEEWACVHLREACLLFVSAITKRSLYVRQSACTSNNLTFARPVMGTIFLVYMQVLKKEAEALQPTSFKGTFCPQYESKYCCKRGCKCVYCYCI